MKGMLSLETSPREVLLDHLQSPRTQTEHKGSMSKANHDARYKRLQFLHRTSDKKISNIATFLQVYPAYLTLIKAACDK